MEQIQIQTKSENKVNKLMLGLLFDAVGMLSYIIPRVAEVVDIIWAPMLGLLLAKMYNGTVSKVGGIIAFLEEATPRLDIPTFTSTWIYTYVIKGENKII